MNHAALLELENTLNDQVYKHVAPLALNAWQTLVCGLNRLQAETAGRRGLHPTLDALLAAIPDRAFKGEL